MRKHSKFVEINGIPYRGDYMEFISVDEKDMMKDHSVIKLLVRSHIFRFIFINCSHNEFNEVS